MHHENLGQHHDHHHHHHHRHDSQSAHHDDGGGSSGHHNQDHSHHRPHHAASVSGDHPHHHHHHRHHHTPISRRQVLAQLVGAAGLALATERPAFAGLPPRASPAQPNLLTQNPPRSASTTAAAAAAPLFRIERVSEGVYAATARPVPLLNSNAAVIVNADHVLVVDTHSKPSAAQALINQIRLEVSDRPVRYVINSHFHWDHAQGNLAYPNSFGQGPEIISSTATREWLAREGASRLRQSLESLPQQISDVKAQLAKAGTAAERANLATRSAELESYLREMTPPEQQIVLPTITFNERLVIHRGGQELHLIFMGRGHTAGDIIVYIPSERAVVTGDLAHGVLPFIGDGYPDEWPRTLAKLEALDFGHVLPGHGSVQHGKGVVAAFRGYLEETNEAVARGVERGSTLEELQRTVTPERLRSLQLGGNGARIEKEMTSAFGPASISPLKGGVATNVAHIYAYHAKKRAGN